MNFKMEKNKPSVLPASDDFNVLKERNAPLGDAKKNKNQIISMFISLLVYD